MKAGDLVELHPSKDISTGSLTAVKYLNRINKIFNQRPAIVLWTDGNNCLIHLSSSEQIVVRKEFLRVINNH